MVVGSESEAPSQAVYVASHCVGSTEYRIQLATYQRDHSPVFVRLRQCAARVDLAAYRSASVSYDLQQQAVRGLYVARSIHGSLHWVFTCSSSPGGESRAGQSRATLPPWTARSSSQASEPWRRSELGPLCIFVAMTTHTRRRCSVSLLTCRSDDTTTTKMLGPGVATQLSPWQPRLEDMPVCVLPSYLFTKYIIQSNFSL